MSLKEFLDQMVFDEWWGERKENERAMDAMGYD